MTKEEFKNYVKTLPQEVLANVVSVSGCDAVYMVRKDYSKSYYVDLLTLKTHDIEVRAPWFMRLFGIKTVHPTKLAEKIDVLAHFGTSVIRRDGDLLSVISTKDKCTKRKRTSLQTSVLNIVRYHCAIVQVDDKILLVC